MEDVVDRMRKDLEIQIAKGDAFRVSDKSPDPKAAMKVADKLGSAFADASLTDGRVLAETTTACLPACGASVPTVMSAAFNDGNGGTPPETEAPLGNPKRVQPGGVTSRHVCPKCHGRVATTDVVCECEAILLPEQERKTLSGPRGWLGLFCFATMVASPFMTAVALVSIVGGAGAAVFSRRVIGVVLLMVAPVIYGLFVGNALMRIRPAGVYHATLYLLSNAVSALGITVVAGVTLGPEAAGKTAGELVRALIVSAAWAAYFGKSKRVLVTYGVEATRRLIAPRHAALVVASVVLLIICSVWPTRASSFSPTGDWVLYSPANSGMAVRFPLPPEEQRGPVSTSAGSATLYSAHVGGGSTALSIGYYDLPPAFAGADAARVLAVIRDTTVSSREGTLLDSRPVTVADVPGFEFTAHTETVALRGRIFLRGRRVIILMSGTPIRASADEIEVSGRFLMSFRPL